MGLRLILAAVSLLATTAAAQEAPAPDRNRLGPALGAVLQADAARARDHLQALSGLSAPVERTRLCILERLDPERALPAPGPEGTFSDHVLHAYRTYWREAVNRPEARDQIFETLKTRLAALLGQSDLGGSEISRLVQERIQAEGLFVLGGGRTGLLQDMMIWSRQEERAFDVDLPEGRHTTRVFLLSDFRNAGWSSWLTCDATGTGGWAKPEGLYAVASSYGDLTGEDFRASFLGHETQHFSDYTAFPGLAGRDLEFRAKLTELSLADTTRDRLLAAFERNQSDNEADAHSHANKRVLAALRARLGLAPDADLRTVSKDALREAARQELFADTARRRAAAAAAPPAA